MLAKKLLKINCTPNIRQVAEGIITLNIFDGCKSPKDLLVHNFTLYRN